MVNWQISNAVFALKFNTTLSLDKIADELIDNENLIIYYDKKVLFIY